MPDSEGPYLTMAVLCERVLQEHDGVPSLIRVVDRIDLIGPFTVGRDTQPEGVAQPPPPIALTLALMIKAGKASGEHKLVVRLRRPDGTSLPDHVVMIELGGDADERGLNFFVPTLITTRDTGVYWFEIGLDDMLVAKAPLRVEHAQTAPVTPPQP